jgi:hypothetical protein
VTALDDLMAAVETYAATGGDVGREPGVVTSIVVIWEMQHPSDRPGYFRESMNYATADGTTRSNTIGMCRWLTEQVLYPRREGTEEET